MKTYTIVRIIQEVNKPEDAIRKITSMLEYQRLFDRTMQWQIGFPDTHDVSQDKPIGKPKLRNN